LLKDLRDKYRGDPDIVVRREKSVKGLGGPNRIPDVFAVHEPSGRVVEVGEAYRSLKSGKPVPREMNKMSDYQRFNIPSVWRRVQ